MTTYASEPGTRLGGRYRLEDRITAGSGWAAWKAIDETLARAVTVFTFASGFPRVSEVVTAARVASRLTDPRLAQVFDVEDAWDRAYIVMEWAAGETLGDLLSQGPLEPVRAARMIAEASAALSSAHAAGVAHMCLSPGSVRWSQTGEVKVVGLGIDAALVGVPADEPVLADTIGLGRLLYAALTAHWPGPDYPPLPPAPTTGGEPCTPRQVVAGVPIALSDLTARAMQLPSDRGAQPLTTPGDLARALLAALPPAPAPAPAQPPAWRDQNARHSRETGHAKPPTDDDQNVDRRRRSGRRADAGWSPPADPSGDTWPPDGLAERDGAPEPARWRPGPGGRAAGRRRASSGLLGTLPKGAVAAAAGVLAVIAIAAFTMWPSGGSPSAGGQPNHKPTSPPAGVSVLTPASASGFDPLSTNDPGNEQSDIAQYAIDSSASTSWKSQWYMSAEFGGTKTGAGLMINMGKSVRFSSVTVTFNTEPGATVELLVGDSGARSKANLDSMTSVASATSPTGTYTFHVTSRATGQYLVIWYTKLPPVPHGGGKFQAQVFNVVVRGTA